MKKLLLVLLVSVAFLSCNKVKLDKYVANSNQSFENAPELDILENSIGDIEWTYISTGVYNGYLEDSFPLDKTFFVLNNGSDGNISGDLRHLDKSNIQFRTFAGFNEFNSLKPSNGCSGISFEIRVYD